MVEILIPKTNVILDATTLTSIMTCPRFTDLQHHHNFQPIGGKANSLEIGSIIHKFMEIYYRRQSEGMSKSQSFGFGMAAAEMYVQGCQYCTNFEPTESEAKPSCGHPVDEYPGLQNTPSESEGYLVGWKFALQTCDEYAKFYANDHWVTLETETVKSKILYEDDEIRILWKAKLDWIVDTNQGIYPADHKTMKQNRDTLSINNQFMGQALVMSTRSTIINKIGLQKTLKPIDKFKRQPVNYSGPRLMEFQSYTLPYWAKQYVAYINQGHFPPNQTSCEGKYGKCKYYEPCESDPAMRPEIFRVQFVVGKAWNPVNSETPE